jgi:hypothetical protein
MSVIIKGVYYIEILSLGIISYETSTMVKKLWDEI